MRKELYQDNYSDLYGHEVACCSDRIIKAKKTLSIIQNFFGTQNLKNLKVLEVGCFVGEISLYLASYFNEYQAIDLDEKAIELAKKKIDPRQQISPLFKKMNAENLEFDHNFFDLVICSHVYEHVPHPDKMMYEIFRVLKKNGVCYFAAGNRFMYMEPHHNLPFLTLLPKKMANIYLRLFRGIDHYYENHFFYYELKKLTSSFVRIDYTEKIIQDPDSFFSSDIIIKKSFKQKIAILICRYFYPFFPTYIWILKKDVY